MKKKKLGEVYVDEETGFLTYVDTSEGTVYKNESLKTIEIYSGLTLDKKTQKEKTKVQIQFTGNFEYEPKKEDQNGK